MIGGCVFVILGIIGVVLLWLPKYELPASRLFSMQDDITRAQFDQDFDRYRDGYGLIQNNPGGESGNGIRYTSEYYILRRRYGFSEHGAKEWSELIRSCMVLSGLLKRSPAPNTDQQGLDDYLCASAASFLLDQTVAQEFIAYGRKHFYFYNNKNPKVYSLSSFLGRYPALICHFHYSAGRHPSLFLRFSWCVTVLWNALHSKTAQDDWVLSYHMINTYLGSPYRSPLIDRLCAYWRVRFYKYWPGGMKQLLTKYFGHEHPLAKWSIEP